MKKLLAIFAIGWLALVGAGCGNREIDPAKVRNAFQSEPQPVKDQLEQGLAAVSAGKYPEALQSLKKVSYIAKMTKEQHDILMDAITKVEKKVPR